MTRRIAQIASWASTEGTGDYPVLVTGCNVVCDDGSVWELSGSTWRRLPDIPQDEPAEPDPITELEAMGGRLHVDSTLAWLLATPGATPDVQAEEIVSEFATISDIRAAAARLLARVRGGGA